MSGSHLPLSVWFGRCAWWGRSRPQEGSAPSWKPPDDPSFGAFSVPLWMRPLHWGSAASSSTCWGPRSWGSPFHKRCCWACGSLCRLRCTKRGHFPPGSASRRRCEAARGRKIKGKRHREGKQSRSAVICSPHCSLLSLLHRNCIPRASWAESTAKLD